MITIIVAADQNNLIGKREQTMGCHGTIVKTLNTLEVQHSIIHY